MNLQKNQIADFRNFIWQFYALNKRDFPWRNIENPYAVVVSEIMLQQTQTFRVLHKYELFVQELPSFQTLADAPLRDVLTLWQGLGYNRRGKFLQQIAQQVVKDHHGILPDDPTILEAFPGLGKATAASIVAFAYNKPTVFIETNIRTVFIHSFFAHQELIHDKEILPLVEQTIDHENPREWYYALMDYGVYLKKMYPHINKKSRHYTKQSKFPGSDRQIRGQIIKQLTKFKELSFEQLIELIAKDSERIKSIIQPMIAEKLIVKSKDNKYQIFE